jgi:hypothetical protein
MPGTLASVAARIVFAFAIFAVLVLAITGRPVKRLIDFDQSFYLTLAYDLGRHGVFSNGVFDDVDSTTSRPPPGMFFSPLYPWLALGAMKLDSRFANAVTCSVEANHKKRDLATCDIYARPMHIIHALFLALGIVAIALTGEIILANARMFFLAGILATVGVAAEAELLSYVMTESIWFSLYSLTVFAFVAALNSGRTRTFVLAGLLLGLLCLTRPSFLVLAPILICLVFVHARWFAPGTARPWLHSAMFGAAFLVLVVPWATRNYVALGKLAMTEEYGSATLVERFAFNDMTAREFLLAFPYCVPKAGPAAVERLFGADAMARFEWNKPGSFFERGRAQRMALVAAHGRLDPIVGDLMRAEMARNWWRHALTSIPLGWCGLWVSGFWSLVMLPLFAWACVAAVRQAKPLFLFYALPAVLLVGLHAAVANHYSRYNFGLIGPLAVGGTWAIARMLSTRWRDRTRTSGADLKV